MNASKTSSATSAHSPSASTASTQGVQQGSPTEQTPLSRNFSNPSQKSLGNRSPHTPSKKISKEVQKELADKVQEQKNNPKANPLATSLMVAGQAAIDEPNNPEHIGKAAEVVQALADQTQSSEHKGALNKIAKLLKGLYKAALEGVAVVGTIAAIATTGGGPIAVLVGAALLIVAAAGGAPGVLTAGLLLVGIGIGSLLVSKAIDAASEPFSNYYTGLFGNPNSNPVGGSH